MSLKDAMTGILQEYKKLEKAAGSRGQRKFRMTRDDVKDAVFLTEYPDRHFGTVISLGPIGFCKNCQQAVDELDRILRPGGKIAVAAWLKQGRDFKDGQYYFSYREFINALRRFKLITTRTIYHDGDRELRGFIGKKY